MTIRYKISVFRKLRCPFMRAVVFPAARPALNSKKVRSPLDAASQIPGNGVSSAVETLNAKTAGKCKTLLPHICFVASPGGFEPPLTA